MFSPIFKNFNRGPNAFNTMLLPEFILVPFRHALCCPFTDFLEHFLHLTGRLKEHQQFSFPLPDFCKTMWDHSRPEHTVPLFCLIGVVPDLNKKFPFKNIPPFVLCLLYTSDAADDLLCVDLGGR